MLEQVVRNDVGPPTVLAIEHPFETLEGNSRTRCFIKHLPGTIAEQDVRNDVGPPTSTSKYTHIYHVSLAFARARATAQANHHKSEVATQSTLRTHSPADHTEEYKKYAHIVSGTQRVARSSDSCLYDQQAPRPSSFRILCSQNMCRALV